MEKVTYYKLIRDKIPQIIEAGGGKCETEVLPQEAYVEALERKLSEELAEYLESKEAEELADLLEVMEALVKARGWTWEQLQTVKEEKKARRGGFEKRLLLKAVERK